MTSHISFINDPVGDQICNLAGDQYSEELLFMNDFETDQLVSRVQHSDVDLWQQLPSSEEWQNNDFTPSEMQMAHSNKRRRRLYEQHGFGIESEAIFKSKCVFERKRQISSFNRIYYESQYQVSHNFANINLLGASSSIDKLFAQFIGDKLADADIDDYVAITIQHKQLKDNSSGKNKSIYISSKVSRFDHQEFVNRLFEVSQSNEKFLLDGKLQVDVAITKKKSGSAFAAKRSQAPRSIEEQHAKSRAIIRIVNNDNACGYWAVAMSKYFQENPCLAKQDRDLIMKNRSNRLEMLARELCLQAKLDYNTPLDGNIMKRLDIYLAPTFQLIVVDGKNFVNRLHVGPDAPRQIYLIHTDEHFNLVTKINAIFKRTYWCHKCWVGYNNEGSHRCEFACPKCHQPNPCRSDETPIDCTDCKRSFWGSRCYSLHKDNSVCKFWKECQACEVEYSAREPHRCGWSYCNKCKTHFNSKHQCYIMPKVKSELLEQDEKLKFIVCFDIESEVQQHGKQEPNLLIARVTCDSCYDYVNKSKSVNNCSKCGAGRLLYKGRGCVKRFSDYLYGHLATRAEKLKARITVLAHNFKGYDGHYILRDLFNRDFNCIEPIMQGTKLLKIDVGNVRFMDSLSFFQQSLASLPKSFGFTEKSMKGYFPHKFNIEKNWTYNGIWPDKEHYEPDYMKPGQVQQFNTWYEMQVGKTFHLQEELIKYCDNDVDILETAIMCSRNSFKTITGLDPITRNFTLASIGLETYRVNFLKEHTLGITPIAGYDAERNQSDIARSWLDWLETVYGQKIQREVKKGHYYVDGLLDSTVFEFWGCFWHGYSRCIKQDRNIAVFDKSPEQLLEKVVLKRDYYRKIGQTLVEVWECEFTEQMQENARLKDFVKSRLQHYSRLNSVGNVSINESFFGGRTNNIKFHHSVVSENCDLSEDEQIRYLDVTSEYPFVLKNFEYPIGHPEVITANFDSTLESYFGFVKCTIEPPKQLYLPVLPTRVNNKLMFLLCRTCGQEQLQKSCNHTLTERVLTGTWTTAELIKALELGYKLVRIHQVLHYEKRSDELFKGYINMWLKVKQEASGWPRWCCTEQDKELYLKRYKEKEGIELDPAKIELNPGRRFIAKLMLNSFWGKLSQRPNMQRTEICKEYFQYWNLITDEEVQIEGEAQVNDDTLVVSWKYKDTEKCYPGNTNIAIASFVTSYARLHLYKQIEISLKNDLNRVLYFDTDSIVFVEHRLDQHKLTTGDYLGDLTDEISDYGLNSRITKFVSGGPKNYAYEIRLPDSSTKVIIKCKGITQTAKTLDIVTIEAMTKLVDLYSKGYRNFEIKVPQLRFTADKWSRIIRTSETFKIYRVVSEKRRVLGNATLPYGFVD